MSRFNAGYVTARYFLAKPLLLRSMRYNEQRYKGLARGTFLLRLPRAPVSLFRARCASEGSFCFCKTFPLRYQVQAFDSLVSSETALELPSALSVLIAYSRQLSCVAHDLHNALFGPQGDSSPVRSFRRRDSLVDRLHFPSISSQPRR